MDDFIYLDYNATTPVDPRVAAAIVATATAVTPSERKDTETACMKT